MLTLSCLPEPDTAHGHELFDERCAACRPLRDKKMGALLGGRRAGAPDRGLPRLASAALIWTSENLDQWLSDRRNLLPARQCRSVIEAASRRDSPKKESRGTGDRSATRDVKADRRAECG
jgi:cytochrome c2